MPLSAAESDLCRRLADRSATLLDQLAEHVAIPTGTDHRPGLDQYRALLIDRLRAMGAEVELANGSARPDWMQLPEAPQQTDVVPPIVIARRLVDPKLPRILIAGHLDTVHPPDSDFRELTIAPDGKTATGPGAVDMKGGILLTIAALEVLAECDVPINWTVLLNSDEERGSFQSEKTLRRVAPDHDIGIAVEPALADGSLAIERMGSGQFKIEVMGRAAHVGRAFSEGISAVTKLAEVVTELGRMPEPENGVIVNVGPLQGGSVTNAVPDHAACWGNVRFGDAEIGERLGAMIDALATPTDIGIDALPRVVVHRHWNRPAKPVTDEVRRLAEKARRAAADLGQSLPFASTGGVCDGNILQDAGLPTIDTLGIRGGNLHRTDEFIEVPSLVERAQLMAVLLSRLSREVEA